MAAVTPPGDLGWQAAEFALPGVDGRTWRLADARGAKGTLVMFLCNHCPYVKAAIPRIVREVAALASHGVAAIAIMPNDTIAYPEDSFANMKLFAERHGMTFPYVIDARQETARAYGAVCTPDFFGFDRDLKLRYRGRLDVGKAGPVPAGARRDLYEAMVAVAETGMGPTEQIPSMGCSIKWRQA